MKKLNTIINTLLLLCPGIALAEWAPFVSVGGGVSSNETHVDVTGVRWNNQNVIKTFDLSSSDPMGSVALGLSNRIQNQYFAIALAASYANNDDTQTLNNYDDTDALISHNTVNFKMPWRYELDAIWGYYFKPEWMLYGKVGATTAKVSATYKATGPLNEYYTQAESSNYLYGAVAGLGITHDLSSHWQLSAEADYIRFDHTSATVNTLYYQGGSSQPMQYTFSYKPNFIVGQLNLTYSF